MMPITAWSPISSSISPSPRPRTTSTTCNYCSTLTLQLHQAVRTARLNSSRQPGLPEQVHAEHVAIFDAIRARDAAQARLHAAAHLRNAAARLGLPMRQPR
jgi:DNA-binding FadR family transcriptional regulator